MSQEQLMPNRYGYKRENGNIIKIDKMNFNDQFTKTK